MKFINAREFDRDLGVRLGDRGTRPGKRAFVLYSNGTRRDAA